MPLQYIDIRDSQVKFVNEGKDPTKKSISLEMDIATIVFESMQEKIKMVQLESELGIAMYEIMNIKMGGV